MIMVEPNPTIQNAKDKIAEAERMMAEARKMLTDAEVEAKRNITDDPLAEYRKAIETYGYTYSVESTGSVVRSESTHIFYPDDVNPYYRHLNSYYAEEAARLHAEIDRMLAFKWCNDQDYEPDWSNPSEIKWGVYFDTAYGHYDIWHTYTENVGPVYFSTRKIAVNCANWLNAKDGYLNVVY